MLNDTIQIKTDYLFGAKITFGWMIGTYNKEFLEAIYHIYKEVNYNSNKINALGLTENYSMEMFFSIFNTYGNSLLVNKELPEYNGYAGDDSKENKLIIDTVATYSGMTKEFTGKVIKQLFWSTEQGRIASSKWIRPRTFMQNAGYRELREDAYGSSWFKNLIWVLVLIGVSIGGFYTLRAYQTYKTTKQIISPKRKLLN